MEFVIEYREFSFAVGMWHRDSDFSDITLAQQAYNKNVLEMPELNWRLIMVIKEHDAQN
jgi:hypothetical protein